MQMQEKVRSATLFHMVWLCLAHQIPYSDIGGDGLVAVKVLQGECPTFPTSLPPYVNSLVQAC